VDDPGRHLDSSDCLDFYAHRAASLSQGGVNGSNGQRSGIFNSRPV
jgi:hypothetical protein